MTLDTSRAEPYILSADEEVAGLSGPVTLRMLAMSEHTGGSVAVMDYTAPPGFPGPPLHRHRDEDEGFFVIEGVLTVQSGDDRHEVAEGGFVWAPRGHAHSFANLGDEPVRFVGLVVPGGLERMFFEIGDHLAETGGEVDQDVLMEINRRYVEVLGPPIGA